MNWTSIGLIAGFMTVSAFIPQIIRGYRLKDLKSLSYFLMIFISIGMALWLTYGLAVRDVPIIVANSIAIILNITLILMKFYYSRKSMLRNP